jgi:hypothetical protein
MIGCSKKSHAPNYQYSIPLLLTKDAKGVLYVSETKSEIIPKKRSFQKSWIGALKFNHGHSFSKILRSL